LDGGIVDGTASEQVHAVPRASRARIGLVAKFTAPVGGILLLALGALSYYSAHTQEDLLYQHLEDKGRELGLFVALISPEAIFAYDFEALDSYVREIVHGQDMIYAVITDPEGRNLTSYVDGDNEMIRGALDDDTELAIAPIVARLRNDPRVMHREFPIVHDQKTIGAVAIGLNRTRIAELSRGAALRHLAMNGGVIALLAIFIYVVFRLYALRPIRTLTQGAHRIERGDLTGTVPKYSEDEFGELSDAFNQMMVQLRTSIGEKDQAVSQLQELNRTLELRVSQRTEELKSSETRLRAIIQSMGEGILTLDDRGYVMSMNPAAERIFRVKSPDAEGIHSALLLDDTHTRAIEDMDDYEEQMNSPFQPTGGSHPAEYLGRRFDGATFPMELVVTAMELGDARLRVCIIRDVTRRKDTERRLAEAQQQLVDAAHKSGMAEMATGVLHNIGNILNSVMLSGAEIARVVSASRLPGLVKANELLAAHRNDLGDFLARDEKGRLLPDYLAGVAHALCDENGHIAREIEGLNEKTAMMKDVIATQQNYARAALFVERVEIAGIVEDALRVHEAQLRKAGVVVQNEVLQMPVCLVHKSKLLQVVTNLIKNAIEAMAGNRERGRPLILRLVQARASDEYASVQVTDNGCGIKKEDQLLIFNHGYTTKPNGHGFGLHTSALAMKEMGGALHAASDGLEHGATFTVLIPLARRAAHDDAPDASARGE
jgi:PAS domain S-box-containing protein